ncbi:unnamed protein product [Tenebrio molitor]|nr:unnamed protein product [Tenebrio molitor]
MTASLSGRRKWISQTWESNNAAPRAITLRQRNLTEY